MPSNQPVPRPAHPRNRRRRLPRQRRRPSHEDPGAPQRVHARLESPSCRLADADVACLGLDEVRGVRLQLDSWKSELRLEQHRVGRTIVVFGGTSSAEPRVARRRVDELLQQHAGAPDDVGARRQRHHPAVCTRAHAGATPRSARRRGQRPSASYVAGISGLTDGNFGHPDRRASSPMFRRRGRRVVSRRPRPPRPARSALRPHGRAVDDHQPVGRGSREHGGLRHVHGRTCASPPGAQSVAPRGERGVTRISRPRGTLGRSSIDAASHVRLLGEEVPVRAAVHTVNGVSAHAARAE
jgi:hypothetical protein